MVAIWADEEGAIDAPLIALVHGTMDRSTGMLRLSRRLDDRYRVLRYDRRGYGRSVDPAGTHPGPFDMAAQIADLVDLLAGRRAVLIGHSFGGDVALAAAARHPDLVVGVALYETPMSWEPWWPNDTGSAIARDAVDHAEAAEGFMRRVIGDALWESLPERTRAVRRREGVAMVGELNDLSTNRPWIAANVRCPVVCARGSGAKHQHVIGMDAMHELFPAIDLIVLDDCRHDAPMSDSDLFANTVVKAVVEAVGGPWASSWAVTSPGSAS
ncbi:MAG: alpha/beta hydrolase fold protein [Acidimicrobiales bacterium]|nr:alpha/beta hydrolase fold protein [Acidimicrobiales bacterium]